MSKYQALQALIKKVHHWQNHHYFTPAEIALISEALETIQFLEIVLKSRS
jgi:hypothetical protein